MVFTALQEHVRLVILRLLEQMPTGKSNASLLTDGLNDACLPVDRAYVVRELRWLEDQGLVILKPHESFDILGAQITDTGEQVATRRKDVPGVKRPRLSSS